MRELDKTLFNKTVVHFILKLNEIIQFLERMYFWYIMMTRALPPRVFFKEFFLKKEFILERRSGRFYANNAFLIENENIRFKTL